jgi:hypothetical protein
MSVRADEEHAVRTYDAGGVEFDNGMTLWGGG